MTFRSLAVRTLAALGLSLPLLTGAPAFAAGANIAMEKWPADRGLNLASLQNGAKLFANYCLGCHSASLVRWNRLQQIGLDNRQIRDFLIFGDQKVGDTIRIAAPAADLKTWFGKTPPDLSVIVRARTSFDYRGTDYLYTLLRGYYRDSASPTGWNNIAYPNIGMPHVFWEEQGPREATIEQIHAAHDAKSGRTRYVSTVSVYDPDGVVRRTERELTAAAEGMSYSFRPIDPARARQFDSDAADLVAFLDFITDPSARTRVRIGVWVMFFLALLTLVTWRLNAVYWKDVK